MSEAGKLGVALVCGLLMLVTVPKLREMWLITGKIPGRQILHATVVGKSHDVSVRGFDYWNLDWELPDPKTGERIKAQSQMELDDWNRLQIGSTVEIARVGNDLHCVNSVFVSPGNFVFDYVLLFGEIVGLVGGLGWFIVADVIKPNKPKSTKPKSNITIARR